MKFHDLLIAAIGRSEIPLRFEPGAEESVAAPVSELIEAWITAHIPENPSTRRQPLPYGRGSFRTSSNSWKYHGGSRIPSAAMSARSSRL